MLASAPISSSPACSRMSARGSPPMYVSCAGRSTSSFIRSSSVVPPARYVSPALRASSSVVARTYSKGRTQPSPARATPLAASPILPTAATICGYAAQRQRFPLMNSRTLSGSPACPLFDARQRRHDLSRRAVPALKGVVVDERLLHGVQLLRRADALDGGDFAAFQREGQRQTRQLRFAVHMDGTRAALPVVAALLRAAQMQAFAQQVEQCHLGRHAQNTGLPIEAQRQRQVDRRL